MKIRSLGAVVGVNLVILLATRVSFDAWVRETFGYLDVDHAIGALRDGVVTTPGAVTGGLMVLQLAALTLSVVVAIGRDSHGVTIRSLDGGSERPGSQRT